jgi:hypothetical protein
VLVEYAKADAEDLLIRVQVSNHGPEQAQILVLPTLWFRNTWSWGRDNSRPSIASGTDGLQQQGRVSTLIARHWILGEYSLYCPGADELLFTENESNSQRLFGVPAPGIGARGACAQGAVC